MHAYVCIRTYIRIYVFVYTYICPKFSPDGLSSRGKRRVEVCAPHLFVL